MSHIPNYNVLIQELIRVRDIAIPTFPVWEDEIYQTYELVNELIYSLWNIDEIIEAIDFNRAIEIGTRLESLAKKLFSLEPHIKHLFASADTTVTWRRSTIDNILQTIESEARLYVSYFRPFVSTDFVRDFSSEEEEDLLFLRTQIGRRVAKTATKTTQWTPEAEKEARRLIQEEKLTTASALQERLSINRKVAQGLFRHIKQKKKKKYRTD